jgi:hypothetical protein
MDQKADQLLWQQLKNGRQTTGRSIMPNDTLAHYFGGDIIRRVLNETGCVGIRIYYAIDDKGKKQVLIVGTDANGDNLLPAQGAAAKADDDPIIVDYSYPCPTICPRNPL